MASIRLHKYLPIASIYFFVNCPAFLPFGLLVTSILSPAFFLWLLLKRRSFVIEKFALALAPFAFMNFLDGIDWKDFVNSSLLMLTVYLTIYAFAVGIQETRNLDLVLRTLIWLNFAFALVGLIVKFTPDATLMWQTRRFGAVDFDRFAGFTYEASYYSTLLAPLVLYSYCLFYQKRNRYSFYLLLATLVPLLLSLSYAVILDVVVGLALTHFVYFKGTRKYTWAVLALFSLILGYFILPSSNPIKQRTIDILTGTDDSEQLRTRGSFQAAWAMAYSKDIWFGVGLGESKDYGSQYMPWSKQLEIPHMPNAVAETLGELGLVGLAFRFVAELVLFLRTRPDKDPLRLSLFIWVFLFQFGGSYKANVAEYVIWVLAFSPSVSFFSDPEPVSKRKLPFTPAAQLV